MSKKVSPTAVGVFVILAIAIAVAALVVLGSGKMFEKRHKFVAYFLSSANGLDKGSDVLLGGVKVGTVEDLFVQFDPDTKQKVIPVIMNLSGDRIAEISAGSGLTPENVFSEKSLDKAFSDGLCAQLMIRSALTGQLYVDLDFLPKEKGYVYPDKTVDGLRQIPTVKNDIEKALESVTKGIEKIDTQKIADLINNLNQTVGTLNEKLSGLNVKELGANANLTLERANTAILHLDGILTSEKTENIIAHLEASLANIKEFTANLDGKQINQVVLKAGDAVDQASLALKKAEGSIGNVGSAAGNVAQLTDQNSPTLIKLNRALEKIDGAADSLQKLTDFLKRNPNAIITGKPH